MAGITLIHKDLGISSIELHLDIIFFIFYIFLYTYSIPAGPFYFLTSIIKYFTFSSISNSSTCSSQVSLFLCSSQPQLRPRVTKPPRLLQTRVFARKWLASPSESSTGSSPQRPIANHLQGSLISPPTQQSSMQRQRITPPRSPRSNPRHRTPPRSSQPCNPTLPWYRPVRPLMPPKRQRIPAMR